MRKAIKEMVVNTAWIKNRTQLSSVEREGGGGGRGGAGAI